MLQTFYATGAGLSFTLLGLWWVVVQFKHAEWMLDRRKARMAYATSLYFLLPGIMSLVSLLAVRKSYLWQVSFAVAGAIGVLEALTAERTFRLRTGGPRWVPALRFVALGLYALVIVFAVRPGLGKSVNLTGLEVEGSILATLLFLGVNFAWLMFASMPAGRQEDPRLNPDRSQPGSR